MSLSHAQTGRTRRRMVSLAGIIALMVGLLTGLGAESASAAPACHPFPDVNSSNIHCHNIQWLKNEKITKPKSGKYHPTNSVTRGQMAAFLFRTVNLNTPSPKCTSRPFPDVPVNNVFCGYIKWAANHHIAYGYSDGHFGPGNPVTRGAMVAFLKRIGAPHSHTPTCTSRPYTDVPVNAVFCGVVTWAKNHGITFGIGHNKFGLTLPVTRQAMASFLHRIFNYRQHHSTGGGNPPNCQHTYQGCPQT